MAKRRAAKRKRRAGEYVCECGAYRFPHRFGGGACTGYELAVQQWEKAWGTGDCRDCMCNQRTHCEVVEGQEAAAECRVVDELIQVNEIKVYRRGGKRFATRSGSGRINTAA